MCICVSKSASTMIWVSFENENLQNFDKWYYYDNHALILLNINLFTMATDDSMRYNA